MMSSIGHQHICVIGVTAPCEYNTLYSSGDVHVYKYYTELRIYHGDMQEFLFFLKFKMSTIICTNTMVPKQGDSVSSYVRLHLFEAEKSPHRKDEDGPAIPSIVSPPRKDEV
ncbi:hypothetical protein ACFX1S_015856 [Malus domestica]